AWCLGDRVHRPLRRGADRALVSRVPGGLGTSRLLLRLMRRRRYTKPSAVAPARGPGSSPDVTGRRYAAGSSPRARGITVFLAVAAVSIPAVLIPLTYFAMSAPSECAVDISEMNAATQDEAWLAFFFAPVATGLLAFAALVRASPGQLRRTR